ncbi:mechanosensitive ion channel family protein [Aquibacillus saliphilus]|uniref:mechanosensitive ion channel family protein n=1 Tax=Aquibacillus saliphilus TaxID=1909422 RepID=UPI001CEFE44E|nr:mechanosensitive ion channel family protein [Aquibacillus saliphilus]
MNVANVLDIIQIILENKMTKITIGAIFSYILYRVLRKLITSFFVRTDFLDEKEESTIESMLISMIKYVITFGFIVYVLSAFDVQVGNILAGAGVIGIIVGFGAQSLIKDLLAGLFLIYEKQLHKGDWIKVNNSHSGVVEDIGLRFLKVREWSGILLTMSNGQVTTIENYNIDKMRVIETITTSFNEDPKRMFTLLEQTCERLNSELSNYLKKDASGSPVEPFVLYGLSSLNDQYRGYQYTVTGLCDDLLYFTAAKEARRMIAEALYDNNIQMAEQHIDLTAKN